ncbi:MAG: TonB-dependent receptor domain-containing protein [Sphingobacteriales bacterium]
MKKTVLIIPVLFFIHFSTIAQHSFKAIVKDSATNENLPGVSVIMNKGKRNGITNNEGKIILKNISEHSATFNFSHIGYDETSLFFDFSSLTDTSAYIIIYLIKKQKDLEEVIVSSSRTESRIENLPTKVEVLGAEEVTEEGGIKPGTIVSLLGDVAGIQTQQTSASSAITDLRIQGLQGKYTQILRDGLPLFGGYSGGLSIMQIPPADIKQVEIIKGASSTLYGGGAIAGLINLISKTPSIGKFEESFLLNQTTLNETNANLWLSSRNKNAGFTFYTGGTYQKAKDVNKDGYSDLPDIKSLFIHPRLFIYPNSRQTLSIGYNAVFEEREGGYMNALGNKTSSFYFNKNKTSRHTIETEWDNKINNKERITVKGNATFFNRQVSTNVFGMNANQAQVFSEASYVNKSRYNDVVAGINFYADNFKKKLPDSTQISNYFRNTAGFFLQDDWRIHPKFTVQAGIRWDYQKQSGNFILPRLSFLYRINPFLTTRLGGGLGYKLPTVFSNEIDERDYPNLLPLASSVVSEKSTGFNWDINFKKKIGETDFTINQSFFLTNIDKPIITSVDANNNISFNNASKPLKTKGFETYIQAKHNEWEVYLGYVYTYAKKLYDNQNPYLSLSARNKFATVVSKEFSEHLRAGVEAAYTGKQFLDNGSMTTGYLFAASMVRYDIHHFTFVLNCENLFDYRQTRKEAIVSGPPTNPIFRQLWAPIDGRVVNLSMQLRW